MKAHELLSKESKWTKIVAARNKQNKVVSSTSKDAVKWCALGALAKCYEGNIEDYLKAYNKLSSVIKGSIGKWNDSNEYETVYKTLKKLNI